jgi:hypothetical protein
VRGGGFLPDSWTCHVVWRAGGAVAGENSTPLPDDGAGPPAAPRWRGWAGRHGPETLIGAVVVTVVGAIVSVVFTSAFEGDGEGSAGSGDRPAAVSSSGTPVAGSATAPSCTGAACAGMDPERTGCGYGAQTLREDWVATMHLEIRYSARCGTVWAKLTGAQTGDTVANNTTPTRRQAAAVRWGQTKYTLMLVAEKEFSAQATAVAVGGNPDEEIPKGYVLRVGADGTHLPSEAPTVTGTATPVA